MKHYLIGSCGISCGLCPRYQSKSKSRCLGCGPDAHCSYCSIFRCCVEKRGYETCVDCGEFPCNKFEKWSDSGSFVSHQKCLANLQRIRATGMDSFLKEQGERRVILELFLRKYNPGRCVSFYCLACTMVSLELLREMVRRIKQMKVIDKVSVMKLVKDLAAGENVDLKLRG